MLIYDVFCWLVDLVWQVARAWRMRRFARGHGFHASSFGPLLASGFDLLARGVGRAIEHGFRGTWRGLPIAVADYSRRWGFPEGDDRRRWYAIAVADVGVEMPRLRLEQETLFFRAEKLLARVWEEPGAVVDVQLGDARFDKAYRVVCDGRAPAVDLLDGEMRAWLLQHSAAYGFELLGSRVLIFSPRRWGRLAGPEELLEVLTGFCERLPAENRTAARSAQQP